MRTKAPIVIPPPTEFIRFPGCVIDARIIGVIEASQTKRGRKIRNDRLIAVPRNRTFTGRSNR